MPVGLRRLRVFDQAVASFYGIAADLFSVSKLIHAHLRSSSIPLFRPAASILQEREFKLLGDRHHGSGKGSDLPLSKKNTSILAALPVVDLHFCGNYQECLFVLLCFPFFPSTPSSIWWLRPEIASGSFRSMSPHWSHLFQLHTTFPTPFLVIWKWGRCVFGGVTSCRQQQRLWCFIQRMPDRHPLQAWHFATFSPVLAGARMGSLPASLALFHCLVHSSFLGIPVPHREPCMPVTGYLSIFFSIIFPCSSSMPVCSGSVMSHLLPSLEFLRKDMS